MKGVTIYTTKTCVYCHRAKHILAQHGVPFTEYDVTDDPDRRRWLVDVTGRRTVPQIFFGEEAVGGCDDLEAIVKAGRLKERLAEPAS